MNTHRTSLAGLTAQCKPDNTNPLTSILFVANVLLWALATCAIILLHITFNHYKRLARRHEIVVNEWMVLRKKVRSGAPVGGEECAM